MVLPRIGAGFDDDEFVAALIVGAVTAAAVEVGIERCIVLVAGMVVAAGGVALPDLHHGLGDRLAVLAEHTAGPPCPPPPPPPPPPPFDLFPHTAHPPR